MNPRFVGIGWVLTLWVIGAALSGSGSWWIPVVIFAFVTALAMMRD